MATERKTLLASLRKQRENLGTSIVLTPVDSLPFVLADREHTGFLHGMYLTDKVRDPDALQEALILFGGREEAGADIAAIHRLLADALGAAEGSLRLLAGLQAHAATFMSISAIGDTVLLLSEDAGGHFSTHAILERLGLRTVEVPVDFERLCVDREATVRLVEQTQPDFVFIDRSEGLRYEDFAFLGALEGPVKIFDASQYLTPLITSRYANPLDWGFDLMLFSLHKSFPGPQKAGVVTREKGELWDRLVKGISTLVSSSHAENTYLLGLALLRRKWIQTYAERLFATASELEDRLANTGAPVVSRALQGEPTWPSTHHIWMRPASKAEAFDNYEALTACGIHTNYRKLPYRLGYGLRLGTTHSTVAGIDVHDIPELAEIIATVLGAGPSEHLRRRVAELAQSASARSILPSAYWLTNG